MTQVLWGLLLLLALPAAGDDAKQAINATLDAFHIAASEADYPAYTALMTEEVVFLGTDATERWQGEAFRKFVRGYFDKGRGWTYVPRQRSVGISPDGDVAWFDELLGHQRLGTCRGSGLLVLGEGGWRVAQYNLSVPIPNDLVMDVAKQIRTAQEAP